ncbi:MAG TPA: elongation factor P maturation arginine rhamnosyltransferase EarP, partial [Burkholderiaceae bacterium]
MRWDIFCRVIDNYGDIGVCWRLAANLAERGQQVRLWADDARALAWMAPQGCPGVQVLPWPTDAPADGPGDVVVEAFGCTIAPDFIAAIARVSCAGGQKPLWINLEYLSAENYVERCHGLPSPVPYSVPGGLGDGLTKYFFYPGFTPATGGLLREPGLVARQAAFDRAAWRKAHGIAEDAWAVSMFCYEPAALGPLLAR